MPVQGFAPISRPDARVLVLGSMPGLASLRARQYYGHPRNAFWPIMGALFGFDAGADYALRVDALTRAGVAVWDVLDACERQGSLDAAIDRRSVVANDFSAFFAAHPAIARVCFNGATAQSLFRRHVRVPAAAALAAGSIRLPSTSPAHAGMPMADKLAAWRVVRPDHRAAVPASR